MSSLLNVWVVSQKILLIFMASEIVVRIRRKEFQSKVGREILGLKADKVTQK
jgi:hypothetical protein